MFAKPVTTARDCVSTFVSVKPMDIFKETSSAISSPRSCQQKWVFLMRTHDIFSGICGNQNTLTKWLMAL